MHGSAHEKGKGEQSAQVDRQTQVSTQMWASRRDVAISSRIQVYDARVFTLLPPRRGGLRCLALIRFRFVSLVWKHGCFSQPISPPTLISTFALRRVRPTIKERKFSALNPDDSAIIIHVRDSWYCFSCLVSNCWDLFLVRDFAALTI